jgi:hypothetical protein
MDAPNSVDAKAIEAHLRLLFGYEAEGYVCLRGIGEKGTAREGVFREDIFLEPNVLGWPAFVASIIHHATRWGQHDVASFVVPCTLKADRGTAENCQTFRTLCADFDTGDTDAKLHWITLECGPPDMVVLSGGVTEEGKAKRHAYWSIKPTEDVAKVVAVRDAIARKVGADIQFGFGVDGNPYGRAHQPIRLAGSIHGKNGVRKPVRIEALVEDAYEGADLATYAEVMERVVPSPWALAEKVAQVGAMFRPEGGDMSDVLTTDVAAGAEGGETRWSAFTRVAGHYIHVARKGDMSIDEAKAAAEGWMLAHMDPPWPAGRFASEWQGLVRKDISGHGPFPKPEAPIAKPETGGILAWAAHRWSLGASPKRQFLVDKLILAGKHHLLVAEGGAGKTFLCLDLALKISSPKPSDDWCGQPITRKGKAVIITTEDDQDELHIRLNDLDPDGSRRREAGDDLIILPTINTGGSFAVVEHDARTGEAKASRKWVELMDMLRQVKPDVVVIDTLNSVLHGEENSATVINEFIRFASQISGELGSATIFTHHIRKQGEEPIRGIDGMKAAIRGSSALPAAFRAVLGIWACADYDRRMTAMGLKPRRGSLWKLGVLKANNPEMYEGEKTLLRSESGLLVDVTANDSYSLVNLSERHAWLLAAITLAARAGHPYSNEGKNAKSGLYRRRAELPPLLRQTGAHEFAGIVEELLMNKAVVVAASKGSKSKTWLDIPTGPIATDSAGAELNAGAYQPQDWDLFQFDEVTKQIARK